MCLISGRSTNAEAEAPILRPPVVKNWLRKDPDGSRWRGRWEGGSGWGTHVNPWLFHFNVWQNSLQIKKKRKEKTLMLGKIESGRRDDRRWDGWMASLTQWTRVWASSGSLAWTGKPGMLQSLGPQRVGHDWVTELNWTELVAGLGTSNSKTIGMRWLTVNKIRIFQNF